MAITVYAKDYMVEQLTTNKTLYVAACETDPEATAPDVQKDTRQEITFGTPISNGKITGTVPDLVIPAGVTVGFVGVYDDLVAGNLIVSDALPNPETYANEGVLTINNVIIRLK